MTLSKISFDIFYLIIIMRINPTLLASLFPLKTYSVSLKLLAQYQMFFLLSRCIILSL